MFSDTYKTLQQPSQGLYKEKGSRFIAHAYPVRSEAEIKEHLENLRKTYHDARHHCFAWKLGFQGEAFRMNDDGEPSGTAGRPIYQQLNAKDLTFTLIVVIRYFGGIKLGVSGLINAYKLAAADALAQADVKECIIRDVYNLTFPYESLNELMKLTKSNDVVLLNCNYQQPCQAQVAVRRLKTEYFLNYFRLLSDFHLQYLHTE